MPRDRPLPRNGHHGNGKVYTSRGCVSFLLWQKKKSGVPCLQKRRSLLSEVVAKVVGAGREHRCGLHRPGKSRRDGPTGRAHRSSFLTVVGTPESFFFHGRGVFSHLDPPPQGERVSVVGVTPRSVPPQGRR